MAQDTCLVSILCQGPLSFLSDGKFVFLSFLIVLGQSSIVCQFTELQLSDSEAKPGVGHLMVFEEVQHNLTLLSFSRCPWHLV